VTGRRTRRHVFGIISTCLKFDTNCYLVIIGYGNGIILICSKVQKQTSIPLSCHICSHIWRSHWKFRHELSPCHIWSHGTIWTCPKIRHMWPFYFWHCQIPQIQKLFRIVCLSMNLIPCSALCSAEQRKASQCWLHVIRIDARKGAFPQAATGFIHCIFIYIVSQIL
jgi:hypothetical protein